MRGKRLFDAPQMYEAVGRAYATPAKSVGEIALAFNLTERRVYNIISNLRRRGRYPAHEGGPRRTARCRIVLNAPSLAQRQAALQLDSWGGSDG